MSVKEFSSELYARYNSLAKDVVADYLVRFNGGFKHTKQPIGEMYKKGDVFFYNNSLGRKQLFELEIRGSSWIGHGEFVIEAQGSGKKFTPNTITVPGRKNQCESAYYVSINSHCDTLAIIRICDVIDSKRARKDTYNPQSSQTTNGENFFEISVKNCFWLTKYNSRDWVLMNTPLQQYPVSPLWYLMKHKEDCENKNGLIVLKNPRIKL